MGKKIHKETYQLQGTINNAICLKTTSSIRKINSDILVKYIIISVCKETGRYYFRKIAENSKRHMGILHPNKHPVRVGNIHIIDEARTDVLDHSLQLVIVAPKEKRGESPIERIVEIKRQSNVNLCPVYTYAVYKGKVVREFCTIPHAKDRNLAINHFFRNSRDQNKQLSVDSIFRIIKSIAIVGINNKKDRISKARVIETRLAATTGILSDEIINQANCSSYYMFDTYYRLINNSSSYIKFHPTQSLYYLPLQKMITIQYNCT
ncbi:hypothetical protein BB561_001662 [Smittium simulii]|uniref:Uncharacterized protein n=1 Tax=Smittium simulii TaxID=133385 RepID=A0A2T9YTU2_9FUNG|nr:hypothetical protein BB561_001662 [Smittium simulii]